MTRGNDQHTATRYRITGIDPSGRKFTGIYTEEQARDLSRDRLNTIVPIRPNVVHSAHTTTNKE